MIRRNYLSYITETLYPVMVNFMCQFHWTKGCPKSCLNIISGISRLSKENCPHQYEYISFNLLRDWIEQKGWGRANLFCLLELGHSLSPVFGHEHFWFSSLQTQTELHQWLSYSSSCRWQVVGLLGNHSHMSQFLQ